MEGKKVYQPHNGRGMAHPEVLEGKGIGNFMEFLEDLDQLALVRLKLQQRVMFCKHLDNHLSAIRMPGTGHLQEPRAPQTW